MEPFSGLVEVEAPAKVNLSLSVLGKRPDGYHELRGLMARLAWGDTIRISFGGEIGASAPRDEASIRDQLTFEGLDASEADASFSGKSNLALGAVAAYRKASCFPDRAVSIHLIKRIPLSSGLGGGSSDAASVLKALERAAGSWGLGEARLKALAAALGGDVPFFLESGPLRLAGGIGEVLIPYSGTLPGDRVLLANPGLRLSTADVFGRLDLTTGESRSKSQDAAAMGAAWPEGEEPLVDKPAYPPLGRNDLLGPALDMAPELSVVPRLLARLSPKPLARGLSGSGPTFWALYGSDEAAAEAASRLEAMALAERPGERWRVVPTRVA